jgi:hypothetical protein
MPKRSHLVMYLPWLPAGAGVRNVFDLASRPAGIAPSVAIERLPVPHGSRGLVLQAHVTAFIDEGDDECKLPDALVGRGAIIEWWSTPTAHSSREHEIADPFLAVLAAQVRAAEVWSTIQLNEAARAWRCGGEWMGLEGESQRLEAWAAGTRASLWAHHGLVP